MNFIKYHAAGNDYLVYNSDLPFGYSQQQISTICDRRRGLGSDGILVPIIGDGDYQVKIFNTDGSEAEKSGNGLRIFCRYLWDRGIISEYPFNVETLGGLVRGQVLDGGCRVSVAMGRARFFDISSPVVNVNDIDYFLNPVSMGNPHCVVFVSDPTKALAMEVGPVIEHLPAFSNRTNVQFARVVDRSTIKVQIWERGVGYTLSSGTSSCAVAAVSYKLGLVDSCVAVHMPGGVISIELDENLEVLMKGPVCKVGTYTLDPECLIIEA
ncbi:diaminopimelate epimerase [Pseudomonas graminis]|uniref:diaminopimelate epimerase n=1 Tax=Pseudomonas graminis TaxID=158627 RepID=UPI00234AF0C3|nr:diaminopimelate epimerase [Pseudomonas graminis]MDC6382027.1 diaminopimelate epimerase [Pseudomonas graminis]